MPKPATQEVLVGALGAARETLQRQLNEADELLNGLDGFVIDELRIDLPPLDGDDVVYAVRVGDVAEGKKLHPQYFHPDRVNTIRAIEAKYKKDGSTTLADVADFVRDQRKVGPGDDISRVGKCAVQYR